MKKHFILLIFFLMTLNIVGQISKNNVNTSPSYHVLIAEYEKLAAQSEIAELQEWGETDSGQPLHVFVINSNKIFDPENFRPDQCVFLINNGIHAGEPCGINASLTIAESYIQKKALDENMIIAIIPSYSIGGMLNRGAHSRANQNGPEEYGFRGNAQLYDLNRDFIKADSKNARSFAEIFHAFRPSIFLDTHTSNGADYQYTMTLISTQSDKAGTVYGKFLRDNMTPALFEKMKSRQWPMSPYVYSMQDIPDKGIKAFYDSPRYSSGYTSLFNCLSFISETHMLKPFEDRVKSTEALIHSIIDFGSENAAQIHTLKTSEAAEFDFFDKHPIDWELDTVNYSKVNFNGYQASYLDSEVTVGERLRYDRDKPFEKEIAYYDRYLIKKAVSIPEYYIIPQAWSEIIDRLKMNKIKMTRISEDTTMTVNSYYIDTYETVETPFEGHYMHYNTKVIEKEQKVRFHAGDYIVYCDQPGKRYIIETLEPEATDSFFNWNFFDIILQQKEYYSSYVFEDKAKTMLENDAALKKEFEAKKEYDIEFALNPRYQLYWLYTKSEHYEPTHMRYPIFRNTND